MVVELVAVIIGAIAVAVVSGALLYGSRRREAEIARNGTKCARNGM